MNLYVETTKKLNDDSAKQYQATLAKLKQISKEAIVTNQFSKGYSEMGIDFDVVCINGYKCVFIYRKNGKVFIETGNTITPYRYNYYVPNYVLKWNCDITQEDFIIEKFVTAINHYLVSHEEEGEVCK